MKENEEEKLNEVEENNENEDIEMVELSEDEENQVGGGSVWNKPIIESDYTLYVKSWDINPHGDNLILRYFINEGNGKFHRTEHRIGGNEITKLTITPYDFRHSCKISLNVVEGKDGKSKILYKYNITFLH